MTAQDMIGWTRDGNGIREKPADAAFDVTIDDAYREIASVTVHSAIYREYLHLVRTLHGWKILSALYMRVREEGTGSWVQAGRVALQIAAPSTA